MTEAMKPSQFKQTKVHYNSREEAVELQKAMFSMGFCWCNHQTGAKRDYEMGVRSKGYIYISDSLRMTHSSIDFSDNTVEEYQEVSKLDIHQAALAHKEHKKQAKKEQRKRKQLRKQGWTIWKATEDSVCPVDDKSNQISVILQSGRVLPSIKVSNLHWNYTGNGTIIAYKLKENIVQEPKKQEDAGGWIKWDGGECPVPKGTLVDVKFRSQEESPPLYKCSALDSYHCWPIYWCHGEGSPGLDIVAYRICKQEDVFVEVPEVDSYPDTAYVAPEYSKPPLGLRPKHIVDSLRSQEILAAMLRYVEADKRVPTEWMDELSDIMKVED